MTEHKFPIAEIFDSVQGEGHWVGTRMSFIRLAGCSVGKPYTAEERMTDGLRVYQEKCTLWTGETFPCDTDYRVSHRYTVKEILQHAAVRVAFRVCITGGEPMMHKEVGTLLEAFSVPLHIETSGTLSLDVVPEGAWVAVSPKTAVPSEEILERADEIKLLVTPATTALAIKKNYGEFLDRVFLQPVNDEFAICKANMARCIELQKDLGPNVRISTQLHKIWGVR
jgi:7-carboxy-7-deazaguanine synthase